MDTSHSEFVWRIHAYLNEHIRFGDAKAIAVLTWCSALIGVLFNANTHKLFMDSSFSWSPELWTTFQGIVSASAFLLLALGFGAAVVAIRPNLRTKKSNGLIFWEGICGYGSGAKYTSAIADKSSDALSRESAHHVFELANIASRKYWWINRGILCAAVGSVLGAITGLFS